MTHTPPEGSGHRWEPSTDQASDSEAAIPPTDPPAAPYANPYAEHAEHVEPAEPAAATQSRRPTRAQAWLAGAAASVLLAGGLGGFAIGRATVDDGAGRVDQQGFSTGFDRDGEGDGGDFQGGGPGVGPGEGLAPPDGQVPGTDGDDSTAQDDGGSASSAT
jgi:hypothetical protein